MKITENCSKCGQKNCIETMHYYDKTGKYKTDPIAFCICRNCFLPSRFDRLPFREDIQFLAIYVVNDDEAIFLERMMKQRKGIACIYCGHSKADFSYFYTDKEGRNFQSTQEKQCIIKLHIKNRKLKAKRKQVGYLCGFCKAVYFDNTQLDFKRDDKWYPIPRRLVKSHPKFTDKQDEHLQNLYERRVALRNEIELKPHTPAEEVHLKARLARLEEKLCQTSHTVLFSLGGYLTHNGIPM